MTVFLRSFISALLILFLISRVSGQTNPLVVNFLNSEIELQQDDDGRLSKQETKSWPQYSGNRYGLLVLGVYPNSKQKAELKAAGIEFLEFIPNRSFVVSLNNSASLHLLAPFEVIGHGAFLPVYKKVMSSSIVPPIAQDENGQVLVNVHPFANIPLESIRRALEKKGFSILEEEPISGYMMISCSSSDISALCELPFVQYIDWKYDAGHPENYTGRTSHRVNYISPENTNGIGYDGTGINVMLQDDGETGPHIDHEGRVEQVWVGNSGDHGDHCGGIICGAGNLSPFNEGQAKGADMFVYKAAPQYQGFDSIGTHYFTKDIVITSTSYSNGCNAGYTGFTQLMDEQVYDLPNLIHVFSAGNSGTSNCGYGAGSNWGNITGGHKMGKNVITVANLNANDGLSGSSSRGPAHDGRIKPDISAKGTSVTSTTEDNTYGVKSGTSMSCPGVSGALAVLYEAFNDVQGSLPKSGLIKAIVLNTADDLGNTGPDFKHGWGRINARKAFELIDSSAFMSGSIANGDSVELSLSVPANTSKARFMLYWTDPEASISASTALINDLDLSVTDPSSATLLPYLLDHSPNAATLDNPATTGQDHLNNMEQVEVMNPAAGSYSVKIKGFNVPQGPQEYFLVYWFEPEDLVLTYPVGGESMAPFYSEKIRWDSPYVTGNVAIEYSSNAGGSWNTVASVPVQQGYYDWTTPNLAAGNVRIRLTYGSEVDESGDFSVIGIPTNLQVDYSCPDSIKLMWSGVSQATGYTIYKLGQKYMDVIGTSVTTSFVDYLSNPLNTNLWYSVSALGPNSAIGKRADAIQKQPGIFDCPLPHDGSIVQLLPSSGAYHSCHGDSLELSFVLKNQGTNPITSLIASANASNGQSSTEAFSVNLTPNASETLSLSTKFSVFSPSEQIVLSINIPNDANSFNDTATGNYYPQNLASESLLWEENFESFDLCSTDGNCEATTCTLVNGWFNEENLEIDDIDWRVDRAGTPSDFTGPDADHTLQTSAGKYLYLEATGDCTGKTAKMVSPCIDLSAATSPTLTFWYHLLGTQMGTLHLDVFNGSFWENDIYIIGGNQGDFWAQASVDLSSYIGSTINLRFRGITGSGYQSDMAIDDISIHQPPIAQFTHDVQNDGVTVTFQDQSLYGSSMTFELGNGTTLSSVPSSFVYAQQMVYTVTQTVTNTYGSDTAVQEVLLNNPPIANFSYVIVGDSHKVSFTDLSLFGDTMSFDLGEGTLLTAVPDTFDYPSPLSYTVTQVVSNNFGSDTATQTLYALGVEELTTGFWIYPNPAKDNVLISSHEPFSELRVWAANGQLVYSEKTNYLSQVTIDVAHFSSGIYFVQVDDKPRIPLSILN